MNGVNDATSDLEGAALANAESASGPSGVDEPAVGTVSGHTLGEHLCVTSGLEREDLKLKVYSAEWDKPYVKDDEGGAVAGGEGWNGFEDTIFSAWGFPEQTLISEDIDRDGIRCSLRGITSKEVVAGLLGAKLANGRKNTEGVASQHNDVAGVPVDYARNLGARDELDGVSAASVLSDANIIVVRNTRSGVVDNILEDGAEADSPENIGLLLSGEVDALGIATTLDVEDTGIGPDVLVVANKESVGVGRKGGLARPGQTEEESDGAVISDVGGGVKGKLSEFDRLEIVLWNAL